MHLMKNINSLALCLLVVTSCGGGSEKIEVTPPPVAVATGLLIPVSDTHRIAGQHACRIY